MKFTESEELELKESTGSLHQAVESIATILNKHDKGVLLFGVKDDGSINGQQVSDSTIRTISESIIRDIEPRITTAIETIDIEGKKIVKVSFSGKEKPYSAFGRFLIRVGTENRRMSRQELLRLAKSEDYSSRWEDGYTGCSLDDLDDDAMHKYYEEATSSDRLEMKEYDPHLLLSVLGMERNGEINNAGIAMFGKNSSIEVKCACYATDEKLTFTDLNLQKGNIYNLVRFSLTYVLNHIDRKISFNPKRTETPEIPSRAIFEIIVNAFAHADYEGHPQIDIDIHPGKIAISNPGSFPEWLSPDDFIGRNITSLKRNPLILSALHRCKNAEKSGTGFRRVDELCKENGVEWSSEKTPFGFSFLFYRNRGVEKHQLNTAIQSLTPSEKEVYSLIESNPKITRVEIAAAIRKTPRTVQNITNSLKRKGYLIRIGNNQFGYWELVFKKANR